METTTGMRRAQPQRFRLQQSICCWKAYRASSWTNHFRVWDWSRELVLVRVLDFGAQRRRHSRERVADESRDRAGHRDWAEAAELTHPPHAQSPELERDQGIHLHLCQRIADHHRAQQAWELG